MSGLGKKRSKFGEFIDKAGVSQGDLMKKSGLNKNTLTKICNGEDSNLREITKTALIEAVRSLTKRDVKIEDFW